MGSKRRRMLSNRPYLIRAFYEWIVDNDCTPYVVVDAHHEDVQVPQNFVTNGQIILNIAPRAVSNFEMDNDHIQLSTRFGGIPIDIFCPMGSLGESFLVSLWEPFGSLFRIFGHQVSAPVQR